LPSLFFVSSSSSIITQAKAGNTYALENTVHNQLGTQIENAFSGIGDFFGFSGDMTAILWAMLFTLTVASIAFLSTGNSAGAMILSIPVIVMATKLGAIPMAMLYTFTLFCVAYLFYFIWLRGT
jgi:hypothetical protein